MKPRKSRWRKWLIITAVCVVVVLGAGYIGLNVAVDYVLKSMLAGSEVDALLTQALEGDLDSLFDGEESVMGAIGSSGTEAVPTGSSGSSDGSGSAIGHPADSNGTDGNTVNNASSGSGDTVVSGSGNSVSSGSGNTVVNDSGNSSNNGAASNPASSGGNSSNAVPGSDSSSGASDPADKLSYTPEVTKDKVEAIQESVTLGEKMKLASVLLSRLNASDIDLFIKMLSGGMTVEEKRAAKDIMLERLTPEEYDELIVIAAKYGLSKGKTYEESLKEKS